MADVFISYVRSDRQIAEAISRELGALGISAFFDEENIVLGGDLKKQLEEHIQKSSLTIVIWSEEAAKSLFVREEIRVALEAWENERLFLVKLDNAELPVGLRDIYCYDYSGMQPDEIAVSIAFDVLRVLIEFDVLTVPSPPPRSPPPLMRSFPLPSSSPLPPPPAPAHRRFRTWIKYSIAILLLLLLGWSTYFFLFQVQYASLGLEPLPEDAILPTGTIAIILILLIIFLSIVVGLVLFFKRRRRLLASSQTRSEHRHEHKDFGSAPDGILFISYSRDDRPKVNVIVNKLERSGLKIWLDTRREADAQRFGRSIVQAIRASKACAFMCSSTAYSSDHVVRELYLADKYSKPMIPVEIETCTLSEDFEYFFSGLQFIPYKPVDRCVQVIIHRLQSSQPPNRAHA